jgi:protocatechuate 3,4-dioxygenase beta subunit
MAIIVCLQWVNLAAASDSAVKKPSQWPLEKFINLPGIRMPEDSHQLKQKLHDIYWQRVQLEKQIRELKVQKVNKSATSPVSLAVDPQQQALLKRKVMLEKQLEMEKRMVKVQKAIAETKPLSATEPALPEMVPNKNQPQTQLEQELAEINQHLQCWQTMAQKKGRSKPETSTNQFQQLLNELKELRSQETQLKNKLSIPAKNSASQTKKTEKPTTPRTDTGSISGTVTDSNGNGISCIKVYLYNLNGDFINLNFTKKYGSYHFSDLEAGDYKIVFIPYSNYDCHKWYNDKDSFATADIVSVTAGQTTTDVNITFSNNKMISGLVTDENGTAIEDIVVYAYNINQNLIAYAVTDHTGNYFLHTFLAGNFKVKFYSDNLNYLSEWYNDKDSFATADSVSILENQSTLNINAQLKQGGMVTGMVADKNGVGIKDIQVSIFDPNNNWIDNANTDASGNYALKGLPSGNYKIEFSVNGQNYLSEWYNDKDSFESADEVMVTVGQTTSGIDAELAEGGMITGTVTDKNGVGIENIQVLIRDLNNNWVNDVYTDNSGVYVLNRLASGSYKIKFDSNDQNYCTEWYNSKDSFDTADVIAVIAGQTISGIDAELAEGGMITGTVTDKNGVGIENIQVRAINLNKNLIEDTYTDGSGEYTLKKLPTGNLKILFLSNYRYYYDEWYNDKDSFETANPVSVIAGQTTPDVNAQLDGYGIISGTITDTQGNGIEDVTIIVFDMDQNFITMSLTHLTGDYQLYEIPPGNYKLIFYTTHSNYLSEMYNDKDSFESADVVEVIAGQTTSGINAQLAAGGIITGTVIDKNGAGINNTNVMAWNISENWMVSTNTDSKGDYTLQGLISGSYKLQFFPEGQNYFPEWYNGKDSFETADAVMVTEGQTTSGVDAQLDEGGMITGTVTDKNGVGLESITVSAWDLNNNCIDYTYTNAAGFYTLYKLFSGNYKIQFYDSNYFPEWYNDKDSFDSADSVSVSEGQTTIDINVQLQQGGQFTGMAADTNGNGIEGIRIDLYDLNKNRIDIVYSDENGNYAFQLIPAGMYKIKFNADGFSYISEWYNDKNSFDTADILELSEGQIVSNINAQLTEGGIVSGIVTDKNNTGVENVYVKTYDLNQNFIRSGYTDSTGIYSIAGIPSGEFKICFDTYNLSYNTQWYNNKNYFSEADILSVTAGQTTANINAQLNDHWIISGIVTDTFGNGLDDCDAYVYDLGGNFINYGYVNPDNGFYFVKDIPNGVYKIEFYSSLNYIPEWYNDKSLFQFADTVTVMADQSITGINAQLKEGGIISGKVISELSSLDVRAYSEDGRYYRSDRVSSDGTYSITGLSSGCYKLFFDPATGNKNDNRHYQYQWYNGNNFFTEAQVIEVKEGETVSGLETTLQETGGMISGYITNGTDPVSNISVKAFPDRYSMESNAYYVINSDSNGYYEIRGLPAGDYVVLFGGIQNVGLLYNAQFYPNTIDINQAQRINVSESSVITNINAAISRPSTISGKVTVSGLDLSGIKVRLIDAENNQFYPLIRSEAVTNKYGNYALVAPPGNWKVLFTPQGQLEKNYSAQFYNQQFSLGTADTITVLPNGSVANINAQLSLGGGTIQGNIRNQSGKVVDFATVELYLADSQTMMDSTRTATNGQFQFSGVIPGEYKVLVHHFLLEPTEWYSDANSFEDAKVITVTDGQTQNIAMVLGGPDEKPRESIVAVFPGEGLWLLDYQEDGSVVSEQWSKQQPDRIRLGDVDGNGIADLAGWFKAKGEFWIRFDNGVWQKWPADAVNMIAFDLADVNNDGFADIVGSWTHGNWWRDAQSGVWERLSKQSPTFLAAGDFEGDGLMDVVGLYPELSSIWIYSRLATPQWKKISNQINLNDLRSADINADGRSEVLGSWDIGTWTFDYTANIWERHSAKPATALCAGDIDGQGKKDIIGDWSPTIPGLWVKFMETGTWKRLSPKIPIDLCSGQVK